MVALLLANLFSVYGIKSNLSYEPESMWTGMDGEVRGMDIWCGTTSQIPITIVSPIETGKSSTGKFFVDLYKTSLIDPREKGKPGPLSYILLLTGSPQDNQPADIGQWQLLAKAPA